MKAMQVRSDLPCGIILHTPSKKCKPFLSQSLAFQLWMAMSSMATISLHSHSKTVVVFILGVKAHEACRTRHMPHILNAEKISTLRT